MSEAQDGHFPGLHSSEKNGVLNMSLQNSMGTVIGKELGICVHWETLTWTCFRVLGRLGWDLREKPLEGTLRV